MAKIAVVGSKSQADIVVYEARSPSEADLCYCLVDKEYDAKGDALWFFIGNTKATCRIFWTDYASEAKLKVFRVKSKYDAKWRKSHPYRNRLG